MQWVALFYSIVVSASRRVTSADLLAIATLAGLTNARTVIASGNLIGTSSLPEPEVENRLEAATLAILGKPIPVICREASAWRQMVAANPFPEETARVPAQVAVRVMRAAPSAETLTRIESRATTGEYFHAQDRALWLCTPGRLSDGPLMRAVSAPWAGIGTFRNASAIVKIANALDG